MRENRSFLRLFYFCADQVCENQWSAKIKGIKVDTNMLQTRNVRKFDEVLYLIQIFLIIAVNSTIHLTELKPLFFIFRYVDQY